MRDWLNKEKLSMELLSSDENLGCISRDSGRAPFDPPFDPPRGSFSELSSAGSGTET